MCNLLACILPDFFVLQFFSLLGPIFERTPRFSQRHVPVLSRWVLDDLLFKTIGINNITNKCVWDVV